MTIRSRPVLDRKHRPRWQDELRTQQLTVIGFAVAIAVALGIFGAAAWNGWWESHLRPVATVDGETYTGGDLDVRERIIGAETVAQITELNAQLGGPRDQLLQQQIDSLSQRLSSIPTTAAQSLVDGAVLRAQAEAFDVSVGDDAVEAEISERVTLPERIQARLVLVEPEAGGTDDEEPAEGEEADDEPTQEQLDAARDAAQAALDRIEDGEEFATVATEVSDDFTRTAGGELGWFEEGDVAYDEYFEALADAEPGDLVGPIEVERGFAVLQLVARRDRTTEGGLDELLGQQGVSDEAYRSYVREQLLVEGYLSHFRDEVVGSSAPQQRVAEIVIRPLTAAAVPQERARHVLVQPDPELDDQAEATEEQWDAALAEAQGVAEQVRPEDADWFAIAEEHSDDTGSASRGGDLGWYDPAASPYVEEFAAALEELEVGEISDPVRTDFGYHVIQKTGERESPEEQAATLVEELRADPEGFAELAERVSENHETAQEGGELGWVARYQLERMLEEAVFALTEPGEISDPVDAGEAGIVIYQLVEADDDREIDEDQLAEIQQVGFERWLDEEVRAPIQTWVDPQFSSAVAAS
ncbi:MAG TPA: peptidylprolyl isomerase [Patescibacteria group bacterium]|nr:peptidylprolyl isomerase [Patescibacteria group bacterium]